MCDEVLLLWAFGAMSRFRPLSTSSISFGGVSLRACRKNRTRVLAGICHDSSLPGHEPHLVLH
jgi:hypothetical protein